MAQLVWDNPKDRYYEAGVDRGVLYFPSAPGKYDNGVAWNGLISVSESFSDDKIVPFYYDGVRYSQEQVFGDYKATLSAYTYPEEFSPFSNSQEITRGFFVDDQKPRVFGLSYRTWIGSSLSSAGSHYKIHLVYNLTAESDDAEYSSQSDSLEAVQFSWTLHSVPEKVTNYRPTAHVIIDSRYIPRSMLTTLEGILYGSDIIIDDIIDGGTPESSGDGFLDGELPISAGFGVVDGNTESSYGSSNPRLPSINELISFVAGFNPKFIVPDPLLGIANLINKDASDLTTSRTPGLYFDLPTTRLTKASLSGVYYLREV